MIFISLKIKKNKKNKKDNCSSLSLTHQYSDCNNHIENRMNYPYRKNPKAISADETLSSIHKEFNTIRAKYRPFVKMYANNRHISTLVTVNVHLIISQSCLII